MRVIVCGGRTFNDRDLVWGTLDKLRSEAGHLVIIQGGATGADELARVWAFRQREGGLINEPVTPEQWEQFGKRAGPLRNQRMIDKHRPDLVLAFPGGRGTADMVRRAQAAGIEVREIKDDTARHH